jgi:hypothetical protein
MRRPSTPAEATLHLKREATPEPEKGGPPGARESPPEPEKEATPESERGYPEPENGRKDGDGERETKSLTLRLRK